jgi:hypothetical protein
MWTKFMKSRAMLLAAAGFMALVTLFAVLAAIRAATDDDPQAVPSAPSTPPSSVSTLPCPTDTASAVPTTRLPGLRWERLGPVLLPYSATSGPCTITATTAAGYAHTPAGAILAAAQIGSRTSITTPLAVATDTIEQQAIAGAARDDLLAKTKARANTPLTEQDAGQLAAWAVLSYSDDTAVISLALSNPSSDGQYVTIPVTVRWSAGDWRLVPPPQGSWDSSAAVTPTLQGYVEWGHP